MRLAVRLAALVEALVRARVAGGRMREAAEDGVPVVAHRVALQRRREVVPAAEVGANGGSVERRAVLELHALAQRERPREAVLRRLPLRRQRGNDLRRARLQADEALEHLVDRPQRLAVRDERAVQHDRIGRGAEHERVVRPAVRAIAPAAASSATAASATGTIRSVFLNLTKPSFSRSPEVQF